MRRAGHSARLRLVGLCGGLLAVLAACGPVSPELAAYQCAERAQAATGPTGQVAVGVGSGGISSKVELGVSSDYLKGRDPYVVYDDCVRQKTGQGPVQPLVLK